MTNDTGFLSDLMPRPWSLEAKHGFRAAGLFVGKGTNAIEVAVARSSGGPTRTALLDSWKARRGGRAAPVLLVVLHPGGAALCGASGEEPPVYPKIDAGQVERLCHEVLDQPDRHAALRFLSQALPSLETDLPGLNNVGLLALHELIAGSPSRADWSDARKKAGAAVGRRGEDLLNALGFHVERLDNLTHLLKSGDRRTALAVLLQETEAAEAGTARFNNLSPVSYALNKADVENLPWVVLVQGNRLRLYSTLGAGVGRRGRTETFIECQPALLKDEHLAHLWLLFSADALRPDGTLHEILEASGRFSGGLAERLRERIYDTVVPLLAAGIADARGLDKPSGEDLELTYQMALLVLFRLLFVAYAEDRDLLPYQHNEAYRIRSLKRKAQELADVASSGAPPAAGDAHWQEGVRLWNAVAMGNTQWGVPAYDGGLFSDDAAVSAAGARLADITLADSVFEPALCALLVIETPEGQLGPVDFRSLGVREFGTIYEGLLESELSVTDVDLALRRGKGKKKDAFVYVPAKRGEEVAVAADQVYLHNRSGARKSTGSYYTKSFAVEHLLEGALEPALEDHFARLDALDETDAAEAFFDFRVADIAMGSGHFLVAAIDRIERAMSGYLNRCPLPGVHRELSALRDAALRHLGELADRATIEDGQLLRRLIARRCIYGVDLNELSVQLARLAVWIHTFVPGLPLSLLDRNLVKGNSLVGVGTIADIRQKFEEAGVGFFPVDANNLLGQAAKPLARLARIADATLQDIEAGRGAMEEVRQAVGATEALCDIIAALPISGADIQFQFERWEEERECVQGSRALGAARKALAGLHAFHFPVAFPEVFLRGRQGFDVILGNPPWQEATLEEHAFWARHFPGLRGLTPREQEAEKARLRAERQDLVAEYEAELGGVERTRKALVGGNYPGMGSGDPDLYKAFCWRFWNLASGAAGRIGVVLPHGSLTAKGSAEFRLAIFRESSNVAVTTLLNNRNWVFPEVHPQTTIGLVALERGDPEVASIHLRGPFRSFAAFEGGKDKPPASFTPDEVLTWTDTASLPLLPAEASIEVFVQMRKAPRLDLNGEGQWRARPDRELDATNQKPLMDLDSEDCPDGFWPVYKGESFDLWEPDTGDYYAFADPEIVIDWLQQKRLRAARRRSDGPHAEFPLDYLRDRSTLPCFAPRVAFRDTSRATDSRTVRACLVPPRLFAANQGPYFLWPRGDLHDQAYLLGVLSSMPLDWYARRFVDKHLNFFVLNPFPIPRPERDVALWRRTVELSGRLACPDERFAEWAEAVGVPRGPLPADEKDDMIHELDAVVAHLYGLSEPQLVHIFETFHEGWDYEQRLRGVLGHYHAWKDRG